MKSALILFFFFWSLQSHATLTITAVGGTSYNDIDTSNIVTTVYGGIAGECTGDGSSTCNSCSNSSFGSGGGGIQACNQKRIYASLPITIYYMSSVALNNVVVQIMTEDQATTTPIEITSQLSSRVTVAANTVTAINTTWGAVCDADPNFDASCLPGPADAEVLFGNTARKLYLRVDENADGDVGDDGEEKTIGIRLHYVKATDAPTSQQTFCASEADAQAGSPKGMCGFKLGIGDEKLYLQEIYGSPTSLTLSSAPAWYGVALAASTSSTDLTPNSIGFVVQRYANTTDYTIEDNTITGLQNYQTYCVLMGNVNKAQNIFKFNLGGLGANTCAETSEVVGILSDKNCFISTAAFGSDMASQVQLLRNFRNEFLAPYTWGRAFVKLYYKMSPPIAHTIEDSEFLKAVTRNLLYPVVALAWLFLNLKFLFLLTGAAVAFYFFRKKVKHA